MKTAKRVLFIVFILVLLIISLSGISSCRSIRDFLIVNTKGEEIPAENMEESSDYEDEEKMETESYDIEAESIKDRESSTDGSNGIEELGEYKILYYEVGINEDSMHFEHRMASIYVINPDGSGKRLIYSDINEKYDLGRVYGISPDGTKISCALFEGGRGAYSALCIIDIATGKLTELVEFDFTEDLPINVDLAIYEAPVWSNDSSKIAYEVISNPWEDPFSGKFRDAGVYIIDIESKKEREVEIDIAGGGVSARNTTFLYPVLFSIDDSKILVVSHPYFQKIEGDEIISSFTKNYGLYWVRDTGSSPEKILDITMFDSEGITAIESFENFKIFNEGNKLLFQVLGAFEEDGDLWSSDIDGDNLYRITSDSRLREQQPEILLNNGYDQKISYIGPYRYGTISNLSESGDLYIINPDGSENKKITDYEIGVSKPVVSPDGKYISYLFSEYDDSVSYVENYGIEIYNTGSDKIERIISGCMIDLIGWTSIN